MQKEKIQLSLTLTLSRWEREKRLFMQEIMENSLAYSVVSSLFSIRFAQKNLEIMLE